VGSCIILIMLNTGVSTDTTERWEGGFLYSYMCFPFSYSSSWVLGTVLSVGVFFNYFCNIFLYLWKGKLKKCFYHLEKWLWLLWVSVELHDWFHEQLDILWFNFTLMWKIMFEIKWIVDFFLQKVCSELLGNLLVCWFLSSRNFCGVVCSRLKECST